MDLDLFNHFGASGTSAEATTSSSGSLKRSALPGNTASKKGRLDELDGIEDRIAGRIVEKVIVSFKIEFVLKCLLMAFPH